MCDLRNQTDQWSDREQVKRAQSFDKSKTQGRKVRTAYQSGDFRVEFIRTNHSIQDAAALAIYSPAGIVVHTVTLKWITHRFMVMRSTCSVSENLQKGSSGTHV